MIASIIIIVISLVLFVYWFRYTCLLILGQQAARNYAPQVASANQLSFLEARDQLKSEVPSDALVSLQRSLDRDYRLLTYLLQHAAAYNVTGRTVEERIMILDYQIMRMWFAVARLYSGSAARRALLEMSSVLNHLANTMGERVAVAGRA